MATPLPRRVNIKELAQALDLSVIHTRRLIKAGRIPAPDRIGTRKQSWPEDVVVGLCSSKREVV